MRRYVFLLIFTVVYAAKCPGNCPAGYFVNGCVNNSTVKCDPCPVDQYKLGTNALTQCTRCTDCIGRNNIEVQRCNGTHDRVCRCRSGYWYDSGVLFCSKCSGCRRGKGVVANCTLTSDTKCQRCVKGVTFSVKYSKTESCIPCKKCGENEELVTLCTRRKDTICKPIPVKKIFQIKNKSKWPFDKVPSTSRSITEEPTIKVPPKRDPTIKIEDIVTRKTESFLTTSVSLAAVKQEKSSRISTTILSTVGALALLLVIVVIVVVIRKYRSNMTQPKQTSNQTPSSPVRRKETPVNRLSTAPLMHGSTDKLLRDISYSLIDDLSRNLNPKGRWKTLAGKLGFSTKDIDNFELQPTRATEEMLSNWAQVKGSTVQHLYDVLKSLRWFVEAEIVSKYL